MTDRTILLAALAERYDAQTATLMDLMLLIGANGIAAFAGRTVEEAHFEVSKENMERLAADFLVDRVVSPNGTLEVSFRRRASAN